ncbi:MAG: sulfatase-like hydrolase/transferase [Planctomycetota bacterium]|nr:sulfatase-like hydrolase/transferase [Planctomycetota bacterium]
MKHAVCIVVDRLSAGFLGAYGNTWIDTPHIDHFASQSTVYDQTLIDSPRLPVLYDSFWRGSHALVARPAAALPGLLQAAGTATWLLTDDAEVADLELAAAFDSRMLVDLPDEPRIADDVAATHFAEFFAAAAGQLSAIERPTLLWLHTRGLATTWDAPLLFREAYAGEEDPAAPDTADVPGLRLEAEFDPDELLGYAHAYAGQVTLLDDCLGGLFQSLDEQGLADNTLVLLVAARGFPLGEHGRVGAVQGDTEGEPLYGELIQVPLIVRAPGAKGSTRSQQLIQPLDVYATLVDWLNGPERADDLPLAMNLLKQARPDRQRRTRAVASGDGGQWALRTPDWLLRHAADERLELYVKPDDRWEINDVADRCPEVVAALCDAYQATCRGDWTSPVELEQDHEVA